MKDPYGLLKPSIPVSYLLLLLEIVAEHGVSQDQLLADVSFDSSLLGNPEARMTPLQWTHLLLNALRLSHDPGLGYEFGLRMRPSSHGFLGYATLSSGSLREAIEITRRYFEARQRNFTLRIESRDDHVILELCEKHPIPVMREFFCENLLLGILRGLAACVGLEMTELPGLEIWFDWPEPTYHARYIKRLAAVRFSRPANLLKIPNRLLDLRPVLADPHASKQAVESCERELTQAGGVYTDVGLRVCAEFVRATRGGYPDQETVAARLNMSTRTLARKLRDGGCSFQQLLEETRRRDAHDLLARSSLEIQEIAALLGYQNPANFTRAFRKWTGESPRDYRSSLQHELSISTTDIFDPQ